MTFSHHNALSKDELFNIEKMINQKIFENSIVSTKVMDYSAIQNDPQIIQFFGDKYGEKVRVVSVGDFSKELCGGTHVSYLCQLGLFKIISESSIAAGVRRIEAVTSTNALEIVSSHDKLLLALEGKLNTSRAKIEAQLTKVLEQADKIKKEHKMMRKQYLEQIKNELKKQATPFKYGQYIAKKLDLDKGELSSLASTLVAEIPKSTILLCSETEGACFIITKVSKTLIENGMSAKDFITGLAPIVDGSGGGNEMSAQAGGTQPKNIDTLLATFQTQIDNL